ncbi:general transcription factor IIE subunit 1-like [Protopterus annectens]|uniref:general transcription factor IIE subunit 1-like n=1 Tax=Protopterus annectens TaxID=7888 RepID=UPI001CFB91F7|nr:general transcription factor IIE subunit 1-like [Protopterus annectens]
MADHGSVITEVPAALKRLAKYVVRGFYSIEYSLALDILIRYPCVKEDDMLLLLKFDKKQLRGILNTLKSDKFIKCRMRVETGPNGKSTRHNYYYINYKVLVDVVKYRLDHVRRKIEADERDSTTRASFKCPQCSSNYTDLEVNQLFNPDTGIFCCTFCGTEVEEDVSSLPKRDARTLLAKFNEQIEPIYGLLHETEDIILPHELLEPQPTEIPSLALGVDQKTDTSPNIVLGRPEKWSNRESSFSDLYVQNVVVNVQKSESKKKQPQERTVKEQPVWMRESTVQGATTDNVAGKNTTTVAKTCDENSNVEDTGADNEVIRTLLIHEKKSSSHVKAAFNSDVNKSDSSSDTSDSEEEKKTAKPEVIKSAASEAQQVVEAEEQDPTVTVAGQPHLYSEVSQNPELVSFMNDEEREAYINIGQQMFQSLYD